MKKNKQFHRYKYLKGLLETLKYKGYPLNLVLGSYLGMMVWKPSKQLFLSYLLLNLKKFPNIESDNIIITYSTERDDYKEFISKLAPKIKPQYVRIENTNKEKASNLINTIISVVRSIVFLRNVECNLKDRLILICGVSLAFKIIDKIETNNIKCEKYIAFNSSYLIESFLTYYFRIRKTKTYSFQHGMYYKYVNEIPFDIMNYENVCADVLLVWGEYSKKQISSFLPTHSKCEVYGYPLENIPKRNTSNNILLLLPRDIYLNESIQLLEYLNKFDEKYLIRAHPSIQRKIAGLTAHQNNISIDNNKTLKETLLKSKYKAVIGFNSTSIFEACLYDQNVLLFRTVNQEFENPGFNEISIQSDLYESISNINNDIDSKYYFKEVNQLDEL